MTLKEMVQKAVKTQDGKTACGVSEQLRQKGFNYADVAAFAKKCSGVSAEDWEVLLYDGDHNEE